MDNVRVGLFSIGLAAYWDQFPGLRQRLSNYGEFVAEKLSAAGADVVDAGMVDDQPSSLRAGDLFAREAVDLVVCYVSTYATSSQVLPAVQRIGRPVLVLNLQPTAQLEYLETGTGEWLANCQACCVPEIACAFERCGVDFHTVTGLLGLDVQTPGAVADEITAEHPAAVAAWREVEGWIAASQVKKSLSRARIGVLGHTYPGMLDMYSDLTQITGQFGIHVELLEMDDLAARVDSASDEAIEAISSSVHEMFDISEDSPVDPLARKPSQEALEYSYLVGAGLQSLATDYDLNGLGYYYRGAAGSPFERLAAGLIVGCSLLTANSIPCSGEGDLKNCVAMKVLDILGCGGSFTELYAMDFKDELILMGHDGPFHLGISEGRPLLRGLSVFHGKSGSGVSVEAEVKNGPITILGLTQTRDGKLKFVCSEGWSIPGPRLRIGNTNSRLRFTPNADDPFDVANWMNAWTNQAPTHHVALGIGHHCSTLQKLAQILKMDFKAVSNP